MGELATTAVLRRIALGEIDIDEITEVLKSTELIVKSYRSEVERLQRTGEQLQLDFDRERGAVDDLTQRLVQLHEENQMARNLLRVEIEGKLQLLGGNSLLDLEALDMAGLIRERETIQKQIGRMLQDR